ncbi:Uncharacterized protein TCM_029143 [Theobroma cacao]|uniref:Uncharacterized protein n=1 Tax=Theobroma cacao TaxID=3641 RepID=A0A061GCZ0_THECC|nr:Uncharacterized protein TCM_029143 [Theobroma cacao]
MRKHESRSKAQRKQLQYYLTRAAVSLSRFLSWLAIYLNQLLIKLYIASPLNPCHREEGQIPLASRSWDCIPKVMKLINFSNFGYNNMMKGPPTPKLYLLH